jgi:hypothetical protein
MAIIRQLGWFALIWAMSVAAVAAVAFGLKLWLAP